MMNWVTYKIEFELSLLGFCIRLKLSWKVSNDTNQQKMPKKGWWILIKFTRIIGEAKNINLPSNTFVFAPHNIDINPVK